MILNQWEQYVTGTNPGSITTLGRTSSRYEISVNVAIFRSYFEDILEYGAISTLNSSASSIVSECIFHKCTNSFLGGIVNISMIGMASFALLKSCISFCQSNYEESYGATYKISGYTKSNIVTVDLCSITNNYGSLNDISYVSKSLSVLSMINSSGNSVGAEYAGLSTHGGNLTTQKCVTYHNSTSASGAMINLNNAEDTLIRCIFKDNHITTNKPLISCTSSRVLVFSCTFLSNGEIDFEAKNSKTTVTGYDCYFSRAQNHMGQGSIMVYSCDIISENKFNYPHEDYCYFGSTKEIKIIGKRNLIISIHLVFCKDIF